MRKISILALLTALIMTSFMFTACGGGGESSDLSDSKYVGSWKASEMSALGESGEFSGGEYVLTLNGDGSGQFFAKNLETGEEDVSDVSWELTKDGFKTTGDTELKFTDEGENIKTKIIGVELIFERQ